MFLFPLRLLLLRILGFLVLGRRYHHHHHHRALLERVVCCFLRFRVLLLGRCFGCV